MDVQLSFSSENLLGDVQITGSKSESNRLLILQALFPQISISNLSNSDDTRVLEKALRSREGEIDVHHAGTAMRFLTAYFASKEGREVVLTGSDRMQERPIKVLVHALRQLGADITYLKKEGFPPLKVVGKKLSLNEVTVEANISSQYISALMLIAPSLPGGLVINLDGKVTSEPYIQMSLKLLEICGIKGKYEENQITIEAANDLPPVEVNVESDWSSASYFYSMAALSREAKISLSSFREFSYQGDRAVAGIYRQLGVETEFEEGRIILRKVPFKKPRSFELDLADSPDLAQTIAVTCFGLGLRCDLTGLHTLRIKETDRLQALKNELTKLGGKVEITADSFHLQASEGIKSGTKIETYNDHRMALAFAALSVKTPMEIADAEVVSKSFPGFWEDLEKLGFSVKNRC
ncbi:3-phosphoshikimate 1-carboxyvinyltransferase [Salinimicrobium catena]|uniref:3-phosphoshikimate 1-carboxyvinyltransferase n=1 Tax=Salinimicrobium catena TaxID=390640 RepID=A0A1H5P291_9FLAO|nr:3-phosphoshikimate 1-carboxyvinyltransferase [Salinimicrobium catena]SDL63453.1 3-phosphoshikimate 1-carboxyvinyltransferase [Salinimicrobium catena]SEF07181.1 3-phosphoshikimate 1-carboxyvinyltransferase [Salinimicrobium catena]